MTGSELWEKVEIGQPLGRLTASISRVEYECQLEGLDNRHPWFTECSPYGEPLLDPFVLIRLAPRLVRESLPHESRAVYASYGVELLRPILPTSEITVSGRIANKYEKRGGKYIHYEVDFSAEDGEPVMKVSFHTLVNAAEVLERKRGQ